MSINPGSHAYPDGSSRWEWTINGEREWVKVDKNDIIVGTSFRYVGRIGRLVWWRKGKREKEEGKKKSTRCGEE